MGSYWSGLMSGPFTPGFSGGTVTSPVLAANGTANAPSYSFTNAATSGMYWDGTNLGFSVGGNEKASLSSGGIFNTTQVTVGAGSATTPSVAVGTTVGWYSSGSQVMNLASGSGTLANAMSITAGANVTFQNKNGSSSANGFTFWSSNGGQVVAMDGHNGAQVFADQGLKVFLRDGANNGEFSNITESSATATLSGATTTIGSNLIPAGCILLGTAIRVTTTATGSGVTSLSIGDGTTATAFGSAIALTAATTTSTANWTISNAPVYPTAKNIVITANGGTFTGGVVRATTFYIQVSPPVS